MILSGWFSLYTYTYGANCRLWLSFFFIIDCNRYDKTEYNEEAVMVVVRKFGKPSLEDEVAGRLEHVVTITAKRFTKGLAQLPLLQQFNYTCGCRSTKTHCVHLSLVLMSDFSLADV